MNNKGFTLIELLAVLVILSIITMIALPSVASSMEKSKSKKLESNKKRAEVAAEMYVTDYKYDIYETLTTKDSCYIQISSLVDEGYLLDSVAGELSNNGIVLYTKPGIYQYKDDKGSYSSCIS